MPRELHEQRGMAEDLQGLRCRSGASHLTRWSKKSSFGVFTEKRLLKTQGLWTLLFSISGLFDSLNEGMQATAYSLRCAAASRRV
jgi:hypothetical protein